MLAVLLEDIPLLEVMLRGMSLRMEAQQLFSLLRAGVNLNRTKAVEALLHYTFTADQIFRALPNVCRYGNMQLVTRMLDRCREGQFRCQDPGELNASVRVAVKKGNPQLVAAILQFRPTLFNSEKLAPHLHKAVRKGYWDIADLLIGAGKVPFPPMISNSIILKIRGKCKSCRISGSEAGVLYPS